MRWSKIPKLNKTFLTTSKAMIAFFVLILVPLSFQDCLTIDDSELNIGCTADCTTVRGRFTTKDGNTPISKMRLEFDWDYSVMEGGSWVRKIATAETEENGNYSITFYAKDEDLEKGHFLLTYHVPEKSFLSSSNNDDGFAIRTDKRDTVITSNFHVPKMEGAIHLKLTNPEAIAGEDRLEARLQCRFGLESEQMHGFQGLLVRDDPMYPSKIADTTIHAAADQYTYINVSGEKNGKHFFTEDSIKVGSGEEITYLIEF
jgi:hypothetical protein